MRPNVSVDVGQVQSKDELHRLLSRELGFPDFYGRNWDAFWDAITGLIEMPSQLTVVGMARLRQRLPREAANLTESLQEYAAQHPDFRLELGSC